MSEVIFRNLLIQFSGLSDFCLHDSNVIIREDEPASIIAFSLNSPHYFEEIEKIRQDSTAKRDPMDAFSDLTGSKRVQTLVKDVVIDASSPQVRASVVSYVSTNDQYSDVNESNERLISQTSSPRLSVSHSAGQSDAPVEEVLLRGGGTHIKYRK